MEFWARSVSCTPLICFLYEPLYFCVFLDFTNYLCHVFLCVSCGSLVCDVFLNIFVLNLNFLHVNAHFKVLNSTYFNLFPLQ